MGIGCDLCDPECNGACEIQNQIPTHNQEKLDTGRGDYLEHEHAKAYQDEHNLHHHHHSVYPNSKHPLGPVTLRLPNEDQIYLVLKKKLEWYKKVIMTM